MFTFEDSGIAIALLAIIIGLRLALYVVERVLANRTAAHAAPLLSPDEIPEETLLPLEETPAAAVRENAQTESSTRFVAELLDSALIAVVLVFLVIRPFVLQAFFIPSGSMEPTLLIHDKLLATKYTYHIREPRRGEIVVFHAPQLALETQGQTYDPKKPVDYVKRVIGLPGERIRIVNGDGVYVNGKRLSEPYVAALPDYNFPTDEDGTPAFAYMRVAERFTRDVKGREFVVPPGQLFVLGDNRMHSHDSHAWGFVPRKALVGKAFVIFWPPNRAGLVR